MSRRSALLILGLAGFSVPSFPAESDRRDGNWWRGLDYGPKLHYATGFFDGMDLGHNFDVWDLIKEKDSASQSCVAKVLASNNRYQTYLQNVTSGQLTDGLNTFYEDYRNRKILIADAVWLTLNSINGMDAAELDKRIQNFRKNAK